MALVLIARTTIEHVPSVGPHEGKFSRTVECTFKKYDIREIYNKLKNVLLSVVCTNKMETTLCSGTKVLNVWCFMPDR